MCVQNCISEEVVEVNGGAAREFYSHLALLHVLETFLFYAPWRPPASASH